MQCCGKEYDAPQVIDGVAYFICSECGEVLEVPNYTSLSGDEFIEQFEQAYAIQLPKQYAKFAGCELDVTLHLPPSHSTSTQFYFGDGEYELNQLASLHLYNGPSLFDLAKQAEEWGLPEHVIPLEGDGHTWLALDYRRSKSCPQVIVMETDEYDCLIVAETFADFASQLENNGFNRA